MVYFKTYYWRIRTKSYAFFTHYLCDKSTGECLEKPKSMIPTNESCSDCERACSAYPYCNGYGYFDNGSQWPGDL